MTHSFFDQKFLRRAAVAAVVILAFLMMSALIMQAASKKDTTAVPAIADNSRAPEYLPAALTPADLTPHQALYEIKMIAKRSGSQLLNIGGTMDFSWHSSCDAFIADHHFDLLYEYTTGTPARIVSDFATYESADGQDFSFDTRRTQNGHPYEAFRGHATRGGEAVFTAPAALAFDLGDHIFFPMAHTLALLNKARAGERFFDAQIFDGSDDLGPVEINAFIGDLYPADERPPVDPAHDEAIDQRLLDSPARMIRMAFFPPQSDKTSQADYEMEMVLHENGIISAMTVEYDDFTVVQKLTALKPYEKSACAPQDSVKNESPMVKE